MFSTSAHFVYQQKGRGDTAFPNAHIRASDSSQLWKIKLIQRESRNTEGRWSSDELQASGRGREREREGCRLQCVLCVVLYLSLTYRISSSLSCSHPPLLSPPSTKRSSLTTWTPYGILAPWDARAHTANLRFKLNARIKLSPVVDVCPMGAAMLFVVSAPQQKGGRPVTMVTCSGDAH